MKTPILSNHPAILELARVLGLDPDSTIGFELRAYPDEIVTLKVRRYVGSEEASSMADLFARHQIKVAEDSLILASDGPAVPPRETFVARIRAAVARFRHRWGAK